MATVTLARIWLHDAADLSNNLTFFSQQPADNRTKDGQVRAYAGGRLRTITRTVRRQTIQITLVDVSDAELELLDAWLGAVLLYRDRHRLLWGSYFSLDPSDYKDGSGWDVGLTFQQVTASAEV